MTDSERSGEFRPGYTFASEGADSGYAMFIELRSTVPVSLVCPQPYVVGSVLVGGAVGEVVDSVVEAVSVEMPDNVIVGPWAKEGSGNFAMDVDRALSPLAGTPGKGEAGVVSGPVEAAGEPLSAAEDFDSPVVGDSVVPFVPRKINPDLGRGPHGKQR